MNKTNLQNEVISDYLKLEKHFLRNLARSQSDFQKVLNYGKWPFINHLLATFGTPATVSQELLTEWNPFFQRIIFRKSPAFERGDADNFTKVHDSSHLLIELVHEALHVYLWEPFFSGRMSVQSYAQFRALSLAFEAICFWYSDLVFTPKLRSRYPDYSVVYEQSAVSSRYFSPYLALKKNGMKDPIKILPAYIRWFSGYTSKELEGPAVDLSAMRRRFVVFTIESEKPLKQLYTQLSRSGIWAEFKARFCDPARGTSCVPDVVVDREALKDIETYCLKVVEQSFQFTSKLSPVELERVQLRRRIQSRAYFALNLRRTIAESRVLFLSRMSPLTEQELKGTVEHYLNLLQSIIADITHSPLPKLKNQLRISDKYYANHIRSILIQGRAWMKDLEQIFPAIQELNQTGIFKLGRPPSLSVLRRLVHRAKSMSDEKSSPEEIALLGRLLVGISSSGGKEPTIQQKVQIMRDYESLMKQPRMLNKWSIFLGSIDPEKEIFREINFRYK